MRVLQWLSIVDEHYSVHLEGLICLLSEQLLSRTSVGSLLASSLDVLLSLHPKDDPQPRIFLQVSPCALRQRCLFSGTHCCLLDVAALTVLCFQISNFIFCGSLVLWRELQKNNNYMSIIVIFIITIILGNGPLYFLILLIKLYHFSFLLVIDAAKQIPTIVLSSFGKVVEPEPKESNRRQRLSTTPLFNVGVLPST